MIAGENKSANFLLHLTEILVNLGPDLFVSSFCSNPKKENRKGNYNII